MPRNDDESAIERLINVYNVATDHSEWRRLADCFTADGVFHGAYGSWNMGEQWEAFGARSARRTEQMGPTRHFVTNILTEVDGDTATSSSFVLVTRTMPDNSTIVSLTGEYQDELVKVDGQWLFASRSVLTDAVGEQGPRPDFREASPS
jgi:hypothetical protein